MATTYKSLASTELGSATSSVTFSSIDSTYTDLVVKITGRCEQNSYGSPMNITMNGLSTSIYSFTWIVGNGTGAGTVSANNSGASRVGAVLTTKTLAGSSQQSNVFSNVEIYIPQYRSSNNKSFSLSAISPTVEATSTDGYQYSQVWGAEMDSTSAITSLTFTASGFNFVAGSSFYLYGVKNS